MFSSLWFPCFVSLTTLSSVICDIYLHNPRGSNNRLDEANRDRQNADRLFDSQNNNRGGYNVGSLYYYQGSILPIEWTNQHSCNSANANCDIIIQFMCSDNLRDGAITKTIPLLQTDCQENNCASDLTYGMHEDLIHYLQCSTRERNSGLFTAEQLLPNVKGPATKTRQNPAGQRRGYECPEERDYYPYWHPSPWVDIAILTNNATRCETLQKESANIKSVWFCSLPSDVLANLAQSKKLVPNNQADCEKYSYTSGGIPIQAVWTESPSHGIDAPECRETEFTRDNHLGNGIGGQPVMYNWTVPNFVQHENCALRIRYNISTGDYISDGNITQTHSLVATEAQARGYQLKNNPVVKIFANLNLDLRLAVNTAQYGRTFQDRSHRFSIRPRPESIAATDTIHNVNVRGKRGNIVQVYPAVEYDFVPNQLHMGGGDYVHFQWTGSNTNPNNNDGQGSAGTDRSNVVLLAEQIYEEGGTQGSDYTYGHWGRSYPSNQTQLLGLPRDDVERLAFLREGQFGGELSLLNDAGTYFDLGPRKVTQTGTYHYLCTRNNNFSNRSQKGKIVCGSRTVSASIGWNGGTVNMVNEALIRVQPATFSSLKKLSVVLWTPDQARMYTESRGAALPIGDGPAGDVIVIHPEQEIADAGKTFTVQMRVTQAPTSLYRIAVFRTATDSVVWTRLDVTVHGGLAEFQTSRGGVYVPVYEQNLPLLVGTVVAVILLVAIVAGSVLYFRRNPDKWISAKKSVMNFKRSTQSTV